MTNTFRPGALWKGLFLATVLVMVLICGASGFEVNEDGQTLIQTARQAYTNDMRDRPVVTDPDIINYVERIAKSLVPKGKNPPPGVELKVTILDSPRPELYSYVDGHVIITTGMIYAMDNEAQLAGLLSHEIAQVVEGYYINMYQEIKAAERRERHKAAASALLGALLDVGVDYAVEVEDINQTERFFSGEATYEETLKRMAAAHAAQSAYYGIKDVVDSIPAKDSDGKWIDPRLRFQAVADAQGMVYLALAGHDASEAAKGWRNAHKISNELAREREKLMGPWAEELRATQSLMELNLSRLRQSMGAVGLVQTVSDAPAVRSDFVAKLTNLKEVQEAQKIHGRKKGRSAYQSFIQKNMLPKAKRALEEEDYPKAYAAYQVLYKKGVRSAPIVYGLAKSKLGDFAFGASEGEKRESEKLYKQALKLDPGYAPAYKGLGELYEDWERYDDAARAYRNYLKIAPKSADRRRVERKIKVLERKAKR
ncbi:MAG: hypothetical protein JRI84_09250 [Deltaproteobacteria bacterium]|nr:hypothetical protein [Deltaproteobacteria bacterium]